MAGVCIKIINGETSAIQANSGWYTRYSHADLLDHTAIV